MTDNAFNQSETLREALSFLGNPDQWDLQNVLERANRRTKTKIARTIVERIYPVVDKQKVFPLSFDELLPISSTQDVKVRLFETLVSDVNYTVDLDIAEITFVSSWADNNLTGFYRLSVEYVPAIAKDLELAYAISDVLRRAVVQTNDEETNIRLNQMREHIKDLTTDINSHTPAPDREAGKSLGPNNRRQYNR